MGNFEEVRSRPRHGGPWRPLHLLDSQMHGFSEALAIHQMTEQ
jgi:hypothetical protein